MAFVQLDPVANTGMLNKRKANQRMFLKATARRWFNSSKRSMEESLT